MPVETLLRSNKTRARLAVAVLTTIVFISQTAAFERELLESRNSMDILEHLV